jgi:MFS family permease
VGKDTDMIQKAIHRLLKRRHFWRYATFTEIAELYASRILRILAFNMTAALSSIFLYQQGYTIWFIALFWAAFYALKVVLAIPAASVVAKFGPKHAILFSNILFIPALVALGLSSTYGLWPLIVMIGFQAVSSILYQIAYMVDFSKVKSLDHAGKEIAYMNIVEKVTGGLSPLIGGLLAFVLGPEIVLFITAALFAVAALPLFHSGEPIKLRQKLSFRGFPWQLIRRTFPAQIALGFDVFTSGTVWSLYTAITIIGIASDEIYAVNGILMSVVLFAALGASYAYGRLIDRRRGKDLLQLASIANALTHFARPLIGSPVGIAVLNIANEAATTGYGMAYTRGTFDNADLSGRRVIYIGINEAVANLGAAIGAALLALLVVFVSEARAMEYFFYIAAGVVLLIATARFPLYRK